VLVGGNSEEVRESGGQSSSGSGGGVNFKDGFPSGLGNNICLPSTGKEIMRKLMVCKGKGPCW
jgi:hypothetical protein